MIYYLTSLGVILKAQDFGKELNDSKYGIKCWFYTEEDCINYAILEGYSI
jgi:hypothetical protein